VKLEAVDVVLVAVAMVVITVITSYRPSVLAARTDHKKHLD